MESKLENRSSIGRRHEHFAPVNAPHFTLQKGVTFLHRSGVAMGAASPRPRRADGRTSNWRSLTAQQRFFPAAPPPAGPPPAPTAHVCSCGASPARLSRRRGGGPVGLGGRVYSVLPMSCHGGAAPAPGLTGRAAGAGAPRSGRLVRVPCGSLHAFRACGSQRGPAQRQQHVS
jgi:hypothetical protein